MMTFRDSTGQGKCPLCRQNARDGASVGTSKDASGLLAFPRLDLLLRCTDFLANADTRCDSLRSFFLRSSIPCAWAGNEDKSVAITSTATDVFNNFIILGKRSPVTNGDQRINHLSGSNIWSFSSERTNSSCPISPTRPMIWAVFTWSPLLTLTVDKLLYVVKYFP